MGDNTHHSYGRELVLDELFDLRLYERLRSSSRGSMAEMLDRLVAVEARHYAFWQEFFGFKAAKLDFGRRMKLNVISVVCRVVGDPAVLLVLEGIEIYGIRKYLNLWDRFQNTPFGDALKEILMDEFQHEDEIVSGFSGTRLSPDRVRGIFLGFNDGLVENLGAVSGFFAALRDPRLVLGASIAVAVAGALSMAAGAFGSVSSEREMELIMKGKARFLGQRSTEDDKGSPLGSGILVGISYFLGACMPVVPVVFGAGNAVLSACVGALSAVVVSTVLAFLSGMNIKRRIALNLGVIALAVTVTGFIGTWVNRVMGVAL